MNLRYSIGSQSAAWRRLLCAAFSLIEIIIVVGLLSLITLGLLMMFNQTQRVFRAGLTQVDVLEGGRLVTDMMTRELQQMSASYRANVVNFYVDLAPKYEVIPGEPLHPLLQTMPGVAQSKRTNLLEEVFFLTRENQTWKGIGYLVRPVDSGVGTLYRFETNSTVAQTPDFLFPNFLLPGFYNTPVANLSRVLDGVVHFKVRAYNPNGQWITSKINTNQVTDVQPSAFALGEIGRYNFWSNALPASVEVEIGVLEDRTLRRAQSIPPGPVRQKYLEDQAGKVHIFRLRIPIRNVDPAAYS